MNITEDHDMNKSEYSAYKLGYQAGLAKAQRDDDDAFWLRQYAGQAMQGILASCHEEARDLPLACRCATLSVEYAKALLEEVKKYEGITNG